MENSRLILFWGLTLVLCVGAGGLRVSLNRERRTNQAHYKQLVNDRRRVARAKYQELRALCKGKDRPTRTEIEQLINKGSPFALQALSQRERRAY